MDSIADAKQFLAESSAAPRRCRLCQLPDEQRALVAMICRSKLTNQTQRTWPECLAFLQQHGIRTTRWSMRDHALHLDEESADA